MRRHLPAAVVYDVFSSARLSRFVASLFITPGFLAVVGHVEDLLAAVGALLLGYELPLYLGFVGGTGRALRVCGVACCGARSVGRPAGVARACSAGKVRRWTSPQLSQSPSPVG